MMFALLSFYAPLAAGLVASSAGSHHTQVCESPSPDYWGEKASQSDFQTDPRCKDSRNECPQWAAAGECEINPAFMVETCPVSCKTCFLLDPNVKCDRLPDELAAVNKGEIKTIFEAIVANNPEMKPELLHSDDPYLIYFDKFLDSRTIVDLLQAYKDAGLGFAKSKELDADEKSEDRRTSESIQCNTAECWRDPRVLKVHEIVMNTRLHSTTPLLLPSSRLTTFHLLLNITPPPHPNPSNEGA
jgi:hypothetical protein